MSLPKFDTVLSEPELMARIDDLAARLAPRLTGDWSAINILIGATPFTSDLMKALARLDIHPVLDALWLESYRDARESSGRVVVRADIARQVRDRGVLIIDDVFDTGRTLAFARKHLIAKGAREVITCALARKPWAPEGDEDVDFHAFDAPPRYLVGYGMDDAGLYRGLPYIGALD
ncbi:MAG: phosphoribosyltransferase family protein [Hyphomonas sp.]|jgi:hypoxanthine phosphoribosyltransferase|nr:hypoxanthine phosphoribosyltransferase [Henriciella sp.]MBO6695183.1 hypoxanthine phosphoribosyltransferase [Henriciella sp.]MCR9224627.1 phosphoribosyltransferase family protein [Hyphomonas sp.]